MDSRESRTMILERKNSVGLYDQPVLTWRHFLDNGKGSGNPSTVRQSNWIEKKQTLEFLKGEMLKFIVQDTGGKRDTQKKSYTNLYTGSHGSSQILICICERYNTLHILERTAGSYKESNNFQTSYGLGRDSSSYEPEWVNLLLHPDQSVETPERPLYKNNTNYKVRLL